MSLVEGGLNYGFTRLTVIVKKYQHCSCSLPAKSDGDVIIQAAQKEGLLFRYGVAVKVASLMVGFLGIFPNAERSAVVMEKDSWSGLSVMTGKASVARE